MADRHIEYVLSKVGICSILELRCSKWEFLKWASIPELSCLLLESPGSHGGLTTNSWSQNFQVVWRILQGGRGVLCCHYLTLILFCLLPCNTLSTSTQDTSKTWLWSTWRLIKHWKIQLLGSSACTDKIQWSCTCGKVWGWIMQVFVSILLIWDLHQCEADVSLGLTLQSFHCTVEPILPLWLVSFGLPQLLISHEGCQID